MSLLALIAASVADGGPPVDTRPYPFPVSAPWNVPQPAPTPTPEGTGEAIHPSVVDFHAEHDQAAWNGYRFWMAMTPYPDASDYAENPCILASHDGYTWVVPAGLTNPIDPNPGMPDYNSDTELVHDPSTERLWCFWREVSGATSSFIVHAAWSTNGTVWTKVENVASVPSDSTYNDVLSPSVVKTGHSSWVMWAGRRHPSDANFLVIVRWTASSPTGPWTAQETCTMNWSGGGGNAWHNGIRLIDGTYYALIDSSNNPDHIFAATSTDGITWNVGGADPIVRAGLGGWDHRPYRAQLTPHENGTHARVWYSASAPDGTWRTGYTEVPLTAWPAPPA